MREVGFGSFLILLLLSLFAAVIITGILYIILSPLLAGLLAALRLERMSPIAWIAFAVFVWSAVLYMLYAALWRGSVLR